MKPASVELTEDSLSDVGGRVHRGCRGFGTHTTYPQRILSTPSCIQSIPAAADQEDFVSMGMNGALKTKQILANARGVLGIELMAAAQALDFRTFTPGKGTLAAKTAIREIVAHLDEDRPLYTDHNAMAAAVERCVILDAVETEVGPLLGSW